MVPKCLYKHLDSWDSLLEDAWLFYTDLFPPVLQLLYLNRYLSATISDTKIYVFGLPGLYQSKYHIGTTWALCSGWMASGALSKAASPGLVQDRDMPSWRSALRCLRRARGGSDTRGLTAAATQGDSWDFGWFSWFRGVVWDFGFLFVCFNGFNGY